MQSTTKAPQLPSITGATPAEGVWTTTVSKEDKAIADDHNGSIITMISVVPDPTVAPGGNELVAVTFSSSQALATLKIKAVLSGAVSGTVDFGPFRNLPAGQEYAPLHIRFPDTVPTGKVKCKVILKSQDPGDKASMSTHFKIES